MMTNPTACRELRPCPFCGSDAEIIEAHDDASDRFAAVQCKKCGAASRQHYFLGDDARDYAASAWNTRAPEGEVVACRLFDGEGGYMYTDDEETIKRCTKVKDGWTDLLYTHPPRATSAEDARKAFAFDALVAAGFVTQAKADESLALADAAMAQRGEVGS